MNEPRPVINRSCDILVVGGGLGGVAATLAACRAGHRVCLTEPTLWLGGQATSQGISVLHEHQHIETFGATASYYAWREGIRDYYRDRLTLSPSVSEAFSPGDCSGDRFSFEPRVGLIVILELLREHVASGNLEIHYDSHPVDADVEQGRVARVRLVQPSYDRILEIEAAYVLDATELGDLLPLCGTPWRIGAESVEQTGEPHARSDAPAPHLRRPFSVPFVVEIGAKGSDHTIPRPDDYEVNCKGQTYSLTERESLADEIGEFWIHDRILAAQQFAPGEVAADLAILDWPVKGYPQGDLIASNQSQRERLVDDAKQVSLGFLYWLQTEAPRLDGSGHGYPELRLRSEALATADGLAMAPHVRESRRMIARVTIREQDVVREHGSGARATFCADSVGIGWHAIDLGHLPGDSATSVMTQPFQIPLGALIAAEGATNLLAACKNIGVTHITSGCYRRHPVEWNIGEAAGVLASYCVEQSTSPASVHCTPTHVSSLQRRLISEGMPLGWFTDIPLGHSAFFAVQQLAAAQVRVGDPQDLLFRPQDLLDDDLKDHLETCGVAAEKLTGILTREEAVIVAAAVLNA